MTRRNIAIALPVLGEEEWLALKEPIETGWLTQGPKVADLEKKFAELHQVKYAIAVTSCTTGLHLVLRAMDVGPGDEVIVPAFTWVATANAALYCGAKPVFVDIEQTTFNLDVNQLVDKITNKTKAIIPVHLFGLCADMDAIRAVVPSHIKILEDAACAAGAKYKGKYAGGLGDAAVFSFHPRKSITTGEGGMVTTNDDALAKKLTQLRNHGASISEEERHRGPKPYILPDFDIVGFNYRMTDLQGALGVVQLKKLERFIEERAKWANYYRETLSELPWLKCPTEPNNGRHGWQSFVTFVDPSIPRNQIMEKLQSQGISTRPGTHAVHALNVYKAMFGLKPQDFPIAWQADQQSMAIPLHNRMSEEDYAYVVEVLRKCVE